MIRKLAFTIHYIELSVKLQPPNSILYSFFSIQNALFNYHQTDHHHHARLRKHHTNGRTFHVLQQQGGKTTFPLNILKHPCFKFKWHFPLLRDRAETGGLRLQQQPFREVFTHCLVVTPRLAQKRWQACSLVAQSDCGHWLVDLWPPPIVPPSCPHASMCPSGQWKVANFQRRPPTPGQKQGD